VGESEIAVDHPHAFLWDGASMHDLNTLVRALGPYELRTANQISNRGWIVGAAADTSGGNARVGFALRPR
jgi:probable HAF family extracellular repeat protein